MKNLTPNIALKVILPSATCSQLATLDKTVIQQVLNTALNHAAALPASELLPPLEGAVRRDVNVRMNGSPNSFIYTITDYDGEDNPIIYPFEVKSGSDGSVVSRHEFTSRDILSKYVERYLAEAAKAQGAQTSH